MNLEDFYIDVDELKDEMYHRSKNDTSRLAELHHDGGDCFYMDFFVTSDIIRLYDYPLFDMNAERIAEMFSHVGTKTWATKEHLRQAAHQIQKYFEKKEHIPPAYC